MGLGDLVGGAIEGVGDLAGGVGDLLGGQGNTLGSLLILEGLKQGFGVLEGRREEKLADKAAERALAARLELQKLSDEAALERLREQIENQLQIAQLNSLSANKRSALTNRARVAQALVNAAVQGGAGEANALLGIPRAVGNIR